MQCFLVVARVSALNSVEWPEIAACLVEQHFFGHVENGTALDLSDSKSRLGSFVVV